MGNVFFFWLKSIENINQAGKKNEKFCKSR